MAKNRLIAYLQKRGLGIISLTILIIIWQLLSVFVIKDFFILPSFSAVVVSLYRLGREIPIDTLISFLHFGMGIAVAMGLGVPIGAIMGWFRIADRIIDPVVELIRPIPPLAWIPFAIIWFGLTHGSASFIIFVGAIFPILINTYAGFRGTPKVLVEAARVLGCTKNLDLMRSVALPSALPSVAAGVRIAMGIGWMCLVAAEIFGRSSGLGYKLWHYYQLHQMDNVIAYMIILGLIGYLLDWCFRRFAEERLLRWREQIVA